MIVNEFYFYFNEIMFLGKDIAELQTKGIIFFLIFDKQCYQAQIRHSSEKSNEIGP